MPTHLLITRPDPDDAIFADAARARLGCGIPFVLSPLIQIEACDPQIDFLPELGDCALILTSRHGVAACEVAVSEVAACENAMPGGPRAAYVVGPATATAARAAGLEVRHVAPDAAALLAHLHATPPQTPLLHLHGEHVARDIAGDLTRAGIPCQEAVVYHQRACALSDRARDLLGGEAPVILPLFSPRSATIFLDQGPFTAPLVIIAISPAVAATVPQGAAAAILTAACPDAPAMLDLLPKALEVAKPLEGQIPPQ